MADVEQPVITAESDSWYYTDDGGIERGPLQTSQLRRLVLQGFVVGPRLVKHVATGDVRDLSLWAELIGASAGDEELAPADEHAHTAADEWNLDEGEWVFIDDDGNVQGPFGTEEMREWVRQGFLEPTREVNVAGGERDDFRPLHEWGELAVAAQDAAVQGATIATPTPAEGDEAAVTEGQNTLETAALASTGAAGTEAFEAVEMTEALRAAAALAQSADAGEALDTALDRAADGRGTESGGADGGAAERGSQAGLAPRASAAVGDRAAAADAGHAAAADAPSWYFVDDGGAVQGPFSTRKMRGWLRRGLLHADRLCRRVEPPSTAPGGPPTTAAAHTADALPTTAPDAWLPVASFVALADAAAAPSATAAAAAADAPAEEPSLHASAHHDAPAEAPTAKATTAEAADGGAAGAEASGAVAGATTLPTGTHAHDDASAALPTGTHAHDDASAALTEEAVWEYVDDRGRLQGPFTGRKLLGWLVAGHLKRTRRARPYVPETAPAAQADAAPSKRLDEWGWFAAALAGGALPAAPVAPPHLIGGAGAGAVEAPLWFYRDVARAEQGPFTATAMQQWIAHGLLPAGMLSAALIAC